MKFVKNILFVFSLLIIMALNSCQKTDTPDIKEPDPPPPPPKVLTENQKYFLDISLGIEFGDSTAKVKKWNRNLKVYLNNPSVTLLVDEFEKIINEINSLSQSFKIERVDTQSKANYVIFFSDKETYAAYEPDAAPYLNSNLGLFWLYWNVNSEIYKGSMYVDIKRTAGDECRKHLLREELTQSLGLLNDTNDYPESIFYADWTCSPSYAEIDQELIGYILNPLIVAGMNRDEATEVLLDLE